MKLKPRFILGIFLILGGGLLLLQSMGILSGNIENIIWSVVLGIGGIYFTIRFLKNRNRWWWIIPGLTFIALAIINSAELFNFRFLEEFSDAILLASIGLSFFIVFFSNRINWWAVIPGGILLTLGFVTVSDKLVGKDFDTAGIFFIGLGLTFFILFIIPTPIGRISWAMYPAIPLLLLGAFVGLGANEAIGDIIGPIAIVIVGLYLLISALRKK
ncbi:MAG: hypothetical protein N2D54_00790 [Chloroflexota bacterium]